VKHLAPSLAALALIAALEAQTPAGAPTQAPAPWQPRPVIIVDPLPYLSSPSPAHRATPRPKRHATPHPRATPKHRSAPGRRRPLTRSTPEMFERIDTSPSPAPPRRRLVS
jgi:hypothetical protein